MNSSPIYYIFTNLLLDAPALLVALVGLVSSVLYWRRFPKSALLTLIGSVLFLLQSVLGILIYGVLPMMLSRQAWRTDSIVTAMRAVHMVQSMTLALSLALLLAAIFRGRTSAQAKTI